MGVGGGVGRGMGERRLPLVQREAGCGWALAQERRSQRAQQRQGWTADVRLPVDRTPQSRRLAVWRRRRKGHLPDAREIQLLLRLMRSIINFSII